MVLVNKMPLESNRTILEFFCPSCKKIKYKLSFYEDRHEKLKDLTLKEKKMLSIPLTMRIETGSKQNSMWYCQDKGIKRDLNGKFIEKLDNYINSY